MPKRNKTINEFLIQASEAITRGLDAETPEDRTSLAALAAACATTIIALTTAAALEDN